MNLQINLDCFRVEYFQTTISVSFEKRRFLNVELANKRKRVWTTTIPIPHFDALFCFLLMCRDEQNPGSTNHKRNPGNALIRGSHCGYNSRCAE